MKQTLDTMIAESKEAFEEIKNRVEGASDEFSDEVSEFWTDLKENFDEVESKLQHASSEYAEKAEKSAYLSMMEAKYKLLDLQDLTQRFTSDVLSDAENKIEIVKYQAELASFKAESTWEKIKDEVAETYESSKEEVEKLKKQDQQGKLYNQVLRFLSYRPRSEKEIRDYLKKKKGRLKIADKIISKLKKQNLIDDQSFVDWWINQRNTFRPRSKFVLMMELRQKGIEEQLIKDNLEKVDDFVLAKKSIQRKVSHYSHLSPSEFHQKAAAFLSRRGFNWELVKKVLEELMEKR